MDAVGQFEFVLGLVAAILVLQVASRVLSAPPAAALIVGGAALAFSPFVPPVTLDPDLVLTLFLPPLLMASAYFTVWKDFRDNIASILLLAVGAVGFTTLCVAVAVRAVEPGLSWAACFALGAVVSPPDAVAAKAVLERVRLPRRTIALLEGESLLNDAAGIVLFRFAVVAAMTGHFSLVLAGASFAGLATGGVAFGWVAAWATILLMRRFRDDQINVTMTLLATYVSYIGAERLGVSGVIAVVVSGLVFGWHQHELLSASERQVSGAVWGVLTWLLEAFVFVLIGLSLRGVVERLGVEDALERFGWPVLAVLGVVIASRFAWILCSDRLRVVQRRWRGMGAAAMPIGPAVAMSWAGMRGVVTLAIALSLPERMPGRDLILVAAFATILVTVLVQGTTLGRVIGWLGIDADTAEAGVLNHVQAMAAITASQFEAVEERAYDAEGTVIHPRLLEQYSYRAALMKRIGEAAEVDYAVRDAHYGMILVAVSAGRAEALRLHRAGRIRDETLRAIEQDLDLQEVSAQRVLDLR